MIRGVVRPPESESWRHGLETDAKTPWQQYVLQVRATGYVLSAVYSLVLLVVLWFRASGYYRTGWYGYWGAVWRSLRTAPRLVLSWSIVPATVFVALCVWYTYDLVIQRLRAGVVSPSWPAPNTAQGPEYAGETYREARERMWYEEQPESAPSGLYRVEAEVVEGKTNLYLAFDIPREDVDRWHRYCKAWQQQRKPAWSVRGFKDFQLGDTYGDINAAFLGRGAVVVSKEYKDGRREYEPNARGRAMLRAFATTPPPGD